MIDKLEVTIDVIIHATEDISQIYQSFEKLLDLKEENFTTHETTGHYDNPIILQWIICISLVGRLLLET